MSRYTFGYINKSSYFLVNSSIYGINLILSPVFYYHFKEAVPVKSIQKARKLAEGLLESKLPEGDYRYYLFQTKEKMVYDIIAFDIKKFESTLKEAGIKKERIKNLSFAAMEFDAGDKLIELDGSVLGSNEGIFFEAPLSLIDENQPKEKIDKILLTKERLNFKIAYGQRNFKEKLAEDIENNLNYISAAVAVFAAIFLMLGISAFMRLDHLEEEKAKLLGNMASKNSIQLKYLKDEYEELNAAQQKIRDAFGMIMAIKGNQGVYLNNINFKDATGWEVSVIAPNQKAAEDLLASLKPKFMDKSNNIYRFRLEL